MQATSVRGWTMPTMSDVKAKECSLAASGFSHPDSPNQTSAVPLPASIPQRTRPLTAQVHLIPIFHMASGAGAAFSRCLVAAAIVLVHAYTPAIVIVPYVRPMRSSEPLVCLQLSSGSQAQGYTDAVCSGRLIAELRLVLQVSQGTGGKRKLASAADSGCEVSATPSKRAKVFRVPGSNRKPPAASITAADENTNTSNAPVQVSAA